jgi:hypothetical protein
MTGKKQSSDDRTGKYGGDDGAMENERAETQPGEDTGMSSSPAGKTAQSKTQAQKKQDKDLKTGEENPA